MAWFAMNGGGGAIVDRAAAVFHVERRCNMARTPIHPGEHLADELEALGMSANMLARQLARSEQVASAK